MNLCVLGSDRHEPPRHGEGAVVLSCAQIRMGQGEKRLSIGRRLAGGNLEIFSGLRIVLGFERNHAQVEVGREIPGLDAESAGKLGGGIAGLSLAV